MSPKAETIVRTAITWIVTVLTPLTLLFIAIRLILNPWFPQIEYRMPGFPDDPYGFTMEDRLRWSAVAMDYLKNGEEISFLGRLTFPDGTPMYNERELSHMVDVKNVVQWMYQVSNVIIGLVIGLGLAAWGAKWAGDYRQGLRQGGRLTVALIVGILIFVVLSFDWLFTQFHRLFFVGDTWIFLFSDTLIRLFPMRFWQDAFLIVGGFTLLGGLALGFLLKPGGLKQQAKANTLAEAGR